MNTNNTTTTWDAIKGYATSITTGGGMFTWVVGNTTGSSNTDRYPDVGIQHMTTVSGYTDCGDGNCQNAIHTPHAQA